ncbi:MAG: hypothetical protein QOG80_3145 [Pseudonocardiales bacterium]|nr:hypothetical protein [Pseudonocardiales bacterium]
MNDRGSTIPLILGFVVVGMFTTAAAVAAGDAFVQQRGLQSVCDGAAAAAAAAAADLGRGSGIGASGYLAFTAVQDAVDRYLAREPDRSSVRVQSNVSPDRTTIALTCTETTHIAFGRAFGKGAGVHHVARSSARAPLSAPGLASDRSANTIRPGAW